MPRPGPASSATVAWRSSPARRSPPTGSFVASGSRADRLDLDGLAARTPRRGPHVRHGDAPGGPAGTEAIVGGGFVACEFAHVFASLGVQVTQIQRSRGALRAQEEEISRATPSWPGAVTTSGSNRRLGCRRAAGVWPSAEGPGGTPMSRPRPCSSPWAAAPNTTCSTPPPVGMESTRRARRRRPARTTARGVWALGDYLLNPPAQARRQPRGRIVAHNLAVDTGRLDGGPRSWPTDRFPTPSSGTRRSPPSARRRRSSTRPEPPRQQDPAFGDVAYGWALEDTTGILTVHATPDGRILGAHCIGPHASTLIQPLIQAASFGQPALEVARGQYWIHPALAEVVENALFGLPLED